MKVKDCKQCEHCKRRVWSQEYKPKNYHAIGFSHAYHYCTKHKKRVLEVKKCDERKNVIEKSLLLLSATQTFIGAAVGENLDRLGMMYGLERLGRSDDEFRAFIRENANAIDERGSK